ncbi:MAG: hypothetical protein QMC62_07585 [Alteromonadaceae bacterium]
MKFFLFATFFIILHSNSLAYEEVNELPPKERSYMGEHNMVLVSQNSTIYASVMTTYVPPSNVQLLYKIENKDLALLQTVRDGRLTTIKTESFNLQSLMQDEKMVIMADVYAGHFARDGMLVYENIPLTFAKRLYARNLDEINDSSNEQEYDVIDLKKNYKIYIHRIQKYPSFAHLLHVDLEAGCLTRFRTSSAVPKESELLFKFLNCGTIKPLHFETKDFEK